MQIIPLSLKEAEAFLAQHGRHYKTPAEPICAIGVADVDEKQFPEAQPADYIHLHGAAILGRREDGDAELAHIYVDGISQGYSLLYGACWRALKALGYTKTAL